MLRNFHFIILVSALTLLSLFVIIAVTLLSPSCHHRCHPLSPSLSHLCHHRCHHLSPPCHLLLPSVLRLVTICVTTEPADLFTGWVVPTRTPISKSTYYSVLQRSQIEIEHRSNWISSQTTRYSYLNLLILSICYHNDHAYTKCPIPMKCYTAKNLLYVMTSSTALTS